MHTPELLRLLEGPEITRFFEQLWGGQPVTTLYRKWLRLVPEGEATTFHVDNSFFSLGTPSLTSAWVPLNDVPRELGGLAVIEGSNHLPGFGVVRRTYGEDFSPGLVRDESGNQLRVDKDVQVMKEYFKLDHVPYSAMSPVIIPSGYTARYIDGEVSNEAQCAAIRRARSSVSNSDRI